LVETNNLLVEFGAVRSGFTSKNKKNWLSGSLGLGFGFRVIAQPTECSRNGFIALRKNRIGNSDERE
jgi:hypothetical protein